MISRNRLFAVVLAVTSLVAVAAQADAPHGRVRGSADAVESPRHRRAVRRQLALRRQLMIRRLAAYSRAGVFPDRLPASDGSV